MTDLAAHANATSAGYVRVQVDRGAGKSPRFISRYEKPIIGEIGSAGGLWIAEGGSDASQAAADTVALNALNGQRSLRYGKNSVAGSGGKGGALTFDVH